MPNQKQRSWFGKRKRKSFESLKERKLENKIIEEGNSSKTPTIILPDLPLKERKKMFTESKEKCLEINTEDFAISSDSGLGKASSSESSAANSFCYKRTPTMIIKTQQGESKSMCVLLNQGLTSRDAIKIDTVLSLVEDVESICSTLRELPLTQVLPLIREIEFRLKTRKSQDIRPWIQWLHYTLVIHMHYLSSIGILVKEMESLHSWLKDRTAFLDKLCELHGKFSVVIEKIDERSSPRQFISLEPDCHFSDTSDSPSNELETMDIEECHDEEGTNSDRWDDEDANKHN